MAIEKPMCLPVNGKWVEYHPVTTPAMITGLEKFLVNTVYPVGSIFQTTTEDDPNELWPGTTWSKMDAGRVLVSAGTYTEGSDTYTYTLGDKGGEAKHQLTAEELASHKHWAYCTTNGAHEHTFRAITQGADQNAGEGGSNYWADRPTSTAGEHSHTVTIDDTGEDKRHENRMPYVVINRWKRTA